MFKYWSHISYLCVRIKEVVMVVCLENIPTMLVDFSFDYRKISVRRGIFHGMARVVFPLRNGW